MGEFSLCVCVWRGGGVQKRRGRIKAWRGGGGRARKGERVERIFTNDIDR